MGNMGRKGYREAEEGMPERDSARPAEILRTEHLRKVYGTGNNEIIAVNDAGISVAQGEFVAIVGSSGSGKSTLMHMLGGVDRPTSGRVFIEDEDIYRMDDDKLAIFRRRQVGLIYQFYNLIPNLTALENVELALQICKDPMDAREVLEEVGLGARLNNFPAQLSGGEQQRAAIARALVNQPSILFADEPTGALDTKTGDGIIKFLINCAHRLNMTILLVTHDMDIAGQCDKIISMKDGQICEN